MNKNDTQLETVNIVKMFGTSNELGRLRKLVDVNGLGFDFDMVIQQPEKLAKMDVDEICSTKEQIHRLITYGAVDILEWRVAFWGTEWINLQTRWFDDSYFNMKTMNAAPTGILRHITNLFEVTLHVVYANSDAAGLFVIKNGTIVEEKAKDEEITFTAYLLENQHSDYEMWKEDNIDKSRSKHLEMQFLFNYGTPYTKKVRQVLDKNSTSIVIDHMSM